MTEQAERTGYDAVSAQQRWQAFWEEDQTFVARDDGSAERRYVLDMFPYPSGDLHMGHAEAFVMGDVVARYLRLRGYDVLHPIGWDAFGLNAENAAISRVADPAEWTYANIETQANSFRRYGLSFDWTRRLHTCDPEYYRWTQWLFLRFRERDLAYRKAGWVNWCPQDQTVLANEQVVAGLCERCGSVVTKRQLTQWYFKITDYAQQLLDDMAELEGGWPDRVLTMQRNWIGRSEGAYVDFQIVRPVDGSSTSATGIGRMVTVFTTRPDTLFGATFFVVAPEEPLAAEIVTDDQRAEFEAYLAQTFQATEIERQSTDRPKTGSTWKSTRQPGERRADPGVRSGLRAERLRHRGDHGRPRARPVRPGLRPRVRPAGDRGGGDRGRGPGGNRHRHARGRHLINSGLLNGLNGKAAGVEAITARLEHEDRPGRGDLPAAGLAAGRATLWVAEIQIIHCGRCGGVEVPNDQLPVELPHLHRKPVCAPEGRLRLSWGPPTGQRRLPRVRIEPAKQDTDTMDTFVDFLLEYLFRYFLHGCTDGPVPRPEGRSALDTSRPVH